MEIAARIHDDGIGFGIVNNAASDLYVVVEVPARGFVLGFLTREFTVDRGQGPEPMIAVYVPTNHLYLGDVIICARDNASFPDITVEQGIRIFLTGGMALSSRMKARRDEIGPETSASGGRSRGSSFIGDGLNKP